MDVEKKFKNIIQRAIAAGVDLSTLPIVQKQKCCQIDSKKFKYIIIAAGLIFIIWYFDANITREDCLLNMPPEVAKVFRPPINCDFCEGKTEVIRMTNLSPDQFEALYAYDGGPIIVTDGAKNWTALTVFNYEYFKEIYEKVNQKQDILNCQFFPYKSGLIDLFDAFNMESDRVKQEKGTKAWYFGWSNCNYEVAKMLRQHYDRPYFLHPSSENNAIDWIFIGVAGYGAHLHIDNVRLPSWQAQLKGTKEWILAPPPECYYRCNFFKTIVSIGEIIVLDTNRWYHQTNVLPGDISLTIGAEYD